MYPNEMVLYGSVLPHIDHQPTICLWLRSSSLQGFHSITSRFTTKSGGICPGKINFSKQTWGTTMYSNPQEVTFECFQDVIDDTWWFIPVSKWDITPVINGISRVNPLITAVISHLLTGNEPPKYNIIFTSYSRVPSVFVYFGVT